MKLIGLSLLVVTALAYQACARDYGTFGHTYPIDEPDLLQDIQTKLMKLEESGLIQHHQNEILEKTKASLANPPAVKGIVKATQNREYSIDPSIVVPYDLKDHEGRIFQKAGTKFNPLSTNPLRTKLVFIQGEDKAQVKWVQEKFFDPDIKVKVILVSGAPFELMESWDKPVFFDQGGVLTGKFEIQAVPAVVEQEGQHLKISEIALKEAS
ncbi:MAG: type-F conjugative transfer system protein TraW [Alphaproteobacteria bacterium]|nr:type-F conjugative transfer system protein TraW [Alphaproteobacteria bacterium]